jgi:hypothetical protein
MQEEILKLEKDFAQAIIKNDSEAIGRILADDWIISSSLPNWTLRKGWKVSLSHSRLAQDFGHRSGLVKAPLRAGLHT